MRGKQEKEEIDPNALELVLTEEEIALYAKPRYKPRVGDTAIPHLAPMSAKCKNSELVSKDPCTITKVGCGGTNGYELHFKEVTGAYDSDFFRIIPRTP